MHRVDTSVRRSGCRWRQVLLCALVGAATAPGCSIYGSPDGQESLETGGSSGSAGSNETGGSSSTGGSDADGGSMAAAGSAGSESGGAGGSSGTPDGGEGGSSGSASGAGGSVGGSAGSDGGSGGSGAGTAGAGGSGGIVELARGKPSTGSGEQLNHSFAHGNDGDTATRWCANAFTFPQHYIVDLEASHELTSFEVTWEYGNRDYTYEVATSEDNQSYVVQDTRTEGGRPQTGSMMPGTMGRYVRITVTATWGNTWASFYEFKVFGM